MGEGGEPGAEKAAVRIAAPSCVLPAAVAENARFLSGRVNEVGLCFFECAACLAYTAADLPPDLASLPLSWHVHLPCDLPWGRGLEAEARCTAELALAVLAKAVFLGPTSAVLHPPEGSPALKRRLLRVFARIWREASPVALLLENISSCDLVELGENFLTDHGLGLCLDVGHVLGYAQTRLESSDLPETADLIHWSAPGRQDEHLPLTELTPAQYAAAGGLAARLPRSAAHLAEIFHWPGVEASLPVLETLLAVT